MNLNQLFCEMIQYYRNDPKRIQHFTKVHSYAKLIGELSGMQGEELLTIRFLETPLLMHAPYQNAFFV